MLYNTLVYNKFAFSEVLDFISSLKAFQVSSVIIDLLKVRFFIKSEAKMWHKIGLLHSIEKNIDSLFSCFGIGQLATNLLCDLVKKGINFIDLEKIIDFIVEDMQDKADVEFVKCTTAFQLSKDEKNVFSSKLESIAAKKVYVEYLIDRSISGGCVIQFKEYCVDASYERLFSGLIREEIKKELKRRDINVNN